MNRHAISLGRVLGISIDLDYSWFLVFGLLTWILAVTYYPAEFKNWSPAGYWAMGAATAILLFVSVLLHELGHSVVAKHFGISVPRITLFIFGGVSQIATEPTDAKTEFWIASAGPAVSLALAAIFWELRLALAGAPALLAIAKYMAMLNLGLGLFNLIPGLPLDGGRVFRAIVWGMNHNYKSASSAAAFTGRMFGFALIFIGVWLVFAGDLLNGLWTAFIGWYLESAAGSQIQQQDLKDFLSGHKVSEMMGRDCARVPGDLTLQQVVDTHVLAHGHRCFVVTHGDQTVGLLTLPEIAKVPRSSWASTKIADVMVPADKLVLTPANAEAWTTVERMEREGIGQTPVVDGGRIIGVFSRDDLVHYLGTLRSLHA
jgi:Zn-dependent protease/CBS domain-containing protein